MFVTAFDSILLISFGLWRCCRSSQCTSFPCSDDQSVSMLPIFLASSVNSSLDMAVPSHLVDESTSSADDVLLSFSFYQLMLFHQCNPSFLVTTLCRPSRKGLALDILLLLACIALVVIFLCSSSCIMFLVAVLIQEGFSFRVAASTKRTLYRFCDNFFLTKYRLPSTEYDRSDSPRHYSISY